MSCRATGATARAEAAINDRLVILCYHRVLPLKAKQTYFQPDLAVTPEALRVHCAVLREHYDLLPLGDAWKALQSGTQRERPLAAMTFDDGYRDNHRYAAPILAEFNLRATFFVVTDLVGRDQPPWYDRLAACVAGCAAQGLDLRENADVGDILGDMTSMTPYSCVVRAKGLSPQRRDELLQHLQAASGAPKFASEDLLMSWDELSHLADAGHEIGSHTRSHPILPQLDDGVLQAEIAGSRKALEENLRRPVTSFCYPNGDFDDRVEKVVAGAGYDCATAVEFGVNTVKENPFRLRRWFMHEDRLRGAGGGQSAALLRMELSGLADRVFRRRRGSPAT